MIGLLLRAYALAERSGALTFPPVEWAFVRSYFAYKRLVEDAYAALTRDRPELFRGGHILDVGANVGYTARVFARAIEPQYRVYAFEPEPVNFRRLQRYGAGERIVPVHAAVGDCDGEVALWRNRAHPGDHRVSVAEVAAFQGARTIVPITTIDIFARTLDAQVRFVKIDVQGYEPAVLRGMTAVAKGDVTIAVEHAPDLIRSMGFDPEEPLTWLRERGFRIEPLGRPQRGYADLLCTR